MVLRKKKKMDDDATLASSSISTSPSVVTSKCNSNSESEGDETCITCGYSPCSLITFTNELQQSITLVDTPAAGVDWNHKEKRFHLYKHFTKLVYGPLGKGERIPLPICVEKRVRERYPSPDGKYAGFSNKQT